MTHKRDDFGLSPSHRCRICRDVYWCQELPQHLRSSFHKAARDDRIRKRPVLPRRGERLEFGQHRQIPADADTAPAWYPVSDSDREARFRRWVKGART